MILALLGAVIIIGFALLMAWAISLAISFWCIAVPLFALWAIWIWGREQERLRNITPDQKALQERDMNLLRAQNDMMRRHKV